MTGLESLKVEPPVVEVKDADVAAMLERLRKQRATWQPIEGQAKEGHQVRVDFEGTLNGEPLEGGKGEDVPIVLGDGQMLPEFEKNLKGVRAGDEKTFTLKFPEGLSRQGAGRGEGQLRGRRQRSRGAAVAGGG